MLFAAGAGDADQAVVEIRGVVGIDHAHVVGLVDVDVAGDQLDVLRVGQHDVVEELERELGELDGLAAAGLDLACAALHRCRGSRRRAGPSWDVRPGRRSS